MKTFVRAIEITAILPCQWDDCVVVAYLASGNRSACILIHDNRDKVRHYRPDHRWGFFNAYRYTLSKQVGDLMYAVSFQSLTPEEAIEKAIKQGRKVYGFSSYYEYTQWLAENIST